MPRTAGEVKAAIEEFMVFPDYVIYGDSRLQHALVALLTWVDPGVRAINEYELEDYGGIFEGFVVFMLTHTILVSPSWFHCERLYQLRSRRDMIFAGFEAIEASLYQGITDHAFFDAMLCPVLTDSGEVMRVGFTVASTRIHGDLKECSPLLPLQCAFANYWDIDANEIYNQGADLLGILDGEAKLAVGRCSEQHNMGETIGDVHIYVGADHAVDRYLRVMLETYNAPVFHMRHYKKHDVRHTKVTWRVPEHHDEVWEALENLMQVSPGRCKKTLHGWVAPDELYAELRRMDIDA